MDSPPPDFSGDLEGFLAWSEKNYKWNPQWCAKHWAPCPVEKKPGLLASVILAQHNISLMPDDVRRGGATAMNSWQENQTSPVCCRLGDEFMDSLWEEVSVNQPEDLEEGQTIVDHPESRPCRAKWPPSFTYSPTGYCYGRLKGHENCV